MPGTNRLVRGGVTEGTRTPDLRDHNLNLSSALSQLREPKGPRPAVPPNRWRPLAPAGARTGPLWHGPSADRVQQSLCSLASRSFWPPVVSDGDNQTVATELRASSKLATDRRPRRLPPHGSSIVASCCWQECRRGQSRDILPLGLGRP
jgi:hypothetical protein